MLKTKNMTVQNIEGTTWVFIAMGGIAIYFIVMALTI
jgi:hypothetical protein